MLGNHQGEESGEKAVKGMREWKPIYLLCVALGLNLAHARQPFTTELEPQHLFLFTFYFKTKLPDWRDGSVVKGTDLLFRRS